MRLLLRGVLCFGLAIAGWETGRWWRQRQPEVARVENAHAVKTPTPQTIPEMENAALAKWRDGADLPQGVMRRLARLRAKDTTMMSEADLAGLVNDHSVSREDKILLVRAWGERNPAAVWEWLKSQVPEGLSFSSFDLFRHWFKTDPTVALQALQTAPSWLWSGAESALLGAWSKGELETSDEVTSILEKIARRGAFSSTFQNLGNNDHSGQIGERIMALPEGELRSSIARRYAQGLFRLNWEKGMNWIKPLPQNEQNIILEQWAGATFAEARFRAGNGRPDNAFQARLARASQWLAETPDDSARSRLGVKYISQLSSTDPKAALEWAQQWLDAAPLAVAVQQVVDAGFEKNRAEISEMLESLPPGGVRMKATDRMASKWMEAAPAEAAAWALTLDKEAMTLQGWHGFGYQWAAKDAAMFQQRIMEATPEQRSMLLLGGVSKMMEAAPLETMDWLRTLSVTARGESTMDNAVSSWTHNDPRAAARYVTAYPGEFGDYTLTSLASSLFQADPQAALSWVEGLPEGEARKEAKESLRQMAEREVDASRREAWLERLK